jgi:transaldolase
MKEKIKKLEAIGHSIWYDNIERGLLNDGTLQGMVDRGEIRGITSNPSILNKAISQSGDYDAEIESYTAKGLSKEEVYVQLAVRDIQQAADLFMPLYNETGRKDGFVSLEVSPYLAHDTEGTIADAKNLWSLVDRPNLMVKIPATLEGLPAITETIAAGININVTLIFSIDRYQAVMDAYLAGLEKRSAQGEDLDHVASVASFFISRIDSKIDQQLQDISKEAERWSGKAGLASGKLAYLAYDDVFGESGKRFAALAAGGAQKQRVLWASTSTKNPAYPDTLYVDELIGPDSVNTVPPSTLQAFWDHGVVEKTIADGLDEAEKVFSELPKLGIDLKQVSADLEIEGLKSFADSYTSLLASLESRMDQYKG